MTFSGRYVLYLFVTFPAALVFTRLSDTLSLIIADVCRAAAARGAKHRALAPLMLLLWSRLRRMDARFQALVARLRSGQTPTASRPAIAGALATRTLSAQLPHRFPSGFGWLVRLMQEAAV